MEINNLDNKELINKVNNLEQIITDLQSNLLTCEIKEVDGGASGYYRTYLKFSNGALVIGGQDDLEDQWSATNNSWHNFPTIQIFDIPFINTDYKVTVSPYNGTTAKTVVATSLKTNTFIPNVFSDNWGTHPTNVHRCYISWVAIGYWK